MIAAYNGFLLIVKMLVEKGANIKMQATNGMDALAAAKECEHIEIVIFLESIQDNAKKSEPLVFSYKQTTKHTKESIIKLNKQGIAEYEAGNYEKSIILFNEVLAYWSKIYNKDIESGQRIATALYNLGLAHKQLNNSQDSLRYFKKAVSISEEIGDQEKAEKYRKSVPETLCLNV